AELNPTGSALVYSTYLHGSSAADSGEAIAVDAAGNAYVTGLAGSVDFPTTPSAFQSSYPSLFGGSVPFVSNLNASGSALVYSTSLDGSDSGYNATDDSGNGIAVDSAGDAYVVGQTYADNFPTTPGSLQPKSTNDVIDNGAAFVTKLNAAG